MSQTVGKKDIETSKEVLVPFNLKVCAMQNVVLALVYQRFAIARFSKRY